MSQNNFPVGWDENKVKLVISHYSKQSEDEAIAEDEESLRPAETVMSIPHDLVSKVRELIAKRQS